MKRLLCPALIALASGTLYGMPPTTGAQWWSTNPNLDCTSIHALIYEVSLASGGTGFACGVTGTFAWLVAGGEWQTSIRTAAPASGAIGVQYLFFDADGKRISLDTASGSLPTSADTVTLALNVNQPSDVRLLGASSDAPQHSTTQTGSVLALFFCADPFVCATVLPQLQYFQPAQPWALSVPIAWDNTFSFLQPSGLSNHWSTVGVNDATHNISFALYNQSPALANFIVRVYDSNGTLAAQGVTTQVPGFNSVDGEGGTRGFVLADIVRTPLPAGILKVVVDSATQLSALFLQFSGNSATTLPAAAEPRPAPPINAVRLFGKARSGQAREAWHPQRPSPGTFRSPLPVLVDPLKRFVAVAAAHSGQILRPSNAV